MKKTRWQAAIKKAGQRLDKLEKIWMHPIIRNSIDYLEKMCREIWAVAKIYSVPYRILKKQVFWEPITKREPTVAWGKMDKEELNARLKEIRR